MKLSNRCLIDSIPALKILADKELPVQAAFQIGRNLRKLAEAYDDYQSTHRTLVDKHALRDANGRAVAGQQMGTVELADPFAFDDEHQQLMAIESELDLVPIKLEALGDIRLTPNTLRPLEWMFER